jgi:hypothetical protein
VLIAAKNTRKIILIEGFSLVKIFTIPGNKVPGEYFDTCLFILMYF